MHHAVQAGALCSVKAYELKPNEFFFPKLSLGDHWHAPLPRAAELTSQRQPAGTVIVVFFCNFYFRPFSAYAGFCLL